MSQATSTVNIYEVLSLGPDGKPLCPLLESADIVTHIRHIAAKSNSSDVNALHGELLNHGKLRRQRWKKLLEGASDKYAGRSCCLVTQQQDVPSSSTSDFDKSAPVSPRDAPHDTETPPLSTAPSTDLTELDNLHSFGGLKVETAKVLADELASICDQSSNEYVAPDLLLQIAPAIVAALEELATTSLSMQLRDTLQPIHSPHDPTIDTETPNSLSNIVERDTASESAEISQQAQVNLSMTNISGPLPATNTAIEPELLDWWSKPSLLVDMLPPGKNIAHRLYLAVSIPRRRSKYDRISRAKERLFAIHFFRLQEGFMNTYCSQGKEDPLRIFLRSLRIEVKHHTWQYAARQGKRYDTLSKSHPGFLFLKFNISERSIRDKMPLEDVSKTIEPSFQGPLIEWYDQLGKKVHIAMEGEWGPWITSLMAKPNDVDKTKNSRRQRISEVIQSQRDTSASSSAPTS
ncbi:unnamed protein product [Clonostachys rosea f. rosea IK726]|uniref:Uncharacterized protein n=2 Tax=Bionectria ochroleuca TaxID=29856 RepID=A0A0B7KL25_BIOOC|nr:unnamed protein product [Clonostachys rosea f. rosea IK726]